MTTFPSILRDIKSIKIQGAQNVAKAATKAISLISSEYKTSPKLLSYLAKAKELLIKTRSTEPEMRNVLNFLTYNLKSFDNPYRELIKRHAIINKHFDRVRHEIITIGTRKIKTGSIIFTHCHSSTVTGILLQAKSEKKEFTVYNTETRPLFQGRITAKELARAHIPVVHFVDSAGRLAMKEADIMLIGADAISSEGKVFNKIGSEMFAEFADKYDVPHYVCTDSWKFDPLTIFGYEEEIERRPGKEVWPTAPEGVKIDNRAFEKISPDLITGIISELGVYKPEIFIEEVRRNYPWMF